MNCAARVKEKTARDSGCKPQHTSTCVDFSCNKWTSYAGVGSMWTLTSAAYMRHNSTHESGQAMPTKSKNQSPKAKALLEEGTLNPNPEKVRDSKFQQNEFFDPRDLIQVRYEMLRRVSIENASVTDATEEYGVSRPTYYQARTNFDERGVAGLVPQKRGPRGPHKLQGEVLAFVEQQLVASEPLRARELVKLIQQEFGINVHPRTIERAVAGKKTPR
jgi:transposase